MISHKSENSILENKCDKNESKTENDFRIESHVYDVNEEFSMIEIIHPSIYNNNNNMNCSNFRQEESNKTKINLMNSNNDSIHQEERNFKNQTFVFFSSTVNKVKPSLLLLITKYLNSHKNIGNSKKEYDTILHNKDKHYKIKRNHNNIMNESKVLCNNKENSSNTSSSNNDINFLSNTLDILQNDKMMTSYIESFEKSKQKLLIVIFFTNYTLLYLILL